MEKRPYLKIFTERLKDLTVEKGVSPFSISKTLKIPQGTMNAWYNEKNFPTVEYLIILSTYFNCTIDYLVGKTDD